MVFVQLENKFNAEEIYLFVYSLNSYFLFFR